MMLDALESDGTVYCINCGNVIWPAARAEALAKPHQIEISAVFTLDGRYILA